jgi:serine/threonine protein kinase
VNVDTWSLGICLYTMLTGERLVSRKNRHRHQIIIIFTFVIITFFTTILIILLLLRPGPLLKLLELSCGALRQNSCDLCSRCLGSWTSTARTYGMTGPRPQVTQMTGHEGFPHG